MALCATQTSTIYPSLCSGDSQNVTLQPIMVSVYFSGTLPKHLLLKESSIPIQISVSLSEELSAFTTPVIEEVVQDDSYSMKSESTSQSSSTTSSEIPIPFLPLPSHFDVTTLGHWMNLRNDIQRWLVSVPQNLPQYTWGTELFWLAFVAANPEFPHGHWCIWDPRIMPVGSFIEGWLDGSQRRMILGECEDNDANHTTLHWWIWDEFTRQASLFFPANKLRA